MFFFVFFSELPENYHVPPDSSTQMQTSSRARGQDATTTEASSTPAFTSSAKKEERDIENSHFVSKPVIGAIIGVSVMVVVIFSIMTFTMAVLIFKLRGKQGGDAAIVTLSQGNVAVVEEQYVDPKLILSRKYKK